MKYKGYNITEPTLFMFEEYIKESNLPISAEEVYNHYKQRSWLTKKGTKAKSVEALCNAWNSIPYNRIGVPKEQSKKGKSKNIDWEQRRYEIAKECLSRLFSDTPMPNIENSVTIVIGYTDALIEKLKND